MADRPRRTGARRGALSAELRAAVRAEAARLGQGPDPVAVTKQVGNFFAAIDRELERVANVRLAAIAAMRAQGWSYDRIAAETGLSKARVAQLVKDARQPARVRRGGRVRPGGDDTQT